jgi:hypothetical protein
MLMKKFMFASALALSLGVTAQGANYYVDANASKGGDGSAKAPYPTIQQAADVAQAGDTVFIKPGTYTETVKPKNSGKEGSPITFRNCPGEEKPTICAGDRVTGPWKVEGGGVYSAACPWNMGALRNHDGGTNRVTVPGNLVVVDGDMMIEAREPNIAGKEQLVEVRRLDRVFRCDVLRGEVVITNAPAWGPDFWKGGVVAGIVGWGSQNGPIMTSSQASNGLYRVQVNTNKAAYWWGHDGNFVGPNNVCFLTGVRAALDREKEYYLDETAGRLYLMAPGAVDPSGMEVYAKKRTVTVDMSGLSHVVFDRVNTMMGGVTLNNATNCVLRNSRHLYASHFFHYTSGRGDMELGTTYDDPAAAAVYVSGVSNRIEGCEIAYAATGVRLDGVDHVVRDCTITDIYAGSYCSGLFISCFQPVGGEFGGHLIERNTIGRVSRSAINWTSLDKPTPFKKSRVLYNHLFDYMEMTEDGGATYGFYVKAGGTEVAYNWVHGDLGHYAFNPGLYVDNDSRDFRFHHNVIWDVKTGIGWNQTSGYLEAYNNTVWARDLGAKNEAIRVTVAVPGCKIFNNLANQTIGGAGPASSQTNNLVVGGGFVGKPDNPASGLDFMLASNSPAINAGVVVPGVTDGAVGAPDLGAYEYGGVAWKAGAGTEPVVPAAPIEFGATAMGAQGVRLGWTDMAFNEKAYVLERSTDGKSWATVANLPANAFTYLDAGFHLKAGTAYQYRLAATNDYGSSAWVSVKTATPLAAKAPAITSPLTAKTMQGVWFTYSIVVANDPAEVTVEGLPKGLFLVTDLDSSGGLQSFGAVAARDCRPPARLLEPGAAVISGYPEEAGEAKVKLTATNAKGADTQTLALSIAKPEPVAIKGGTVSEYADAKGVRWTVLTFTNSGSFAVSGGPAEYLIVAGGGGGGVSGGGGAGGVVTGAVMALKGEHKVLVGVGGEAVTNGEPSSITGSSITWTATGGGAGGTWKVDGKDGGSGGGAGKNSAKGGKALPPVAVATRQDATLKQGNKGGDSNGDTYRGAGGGGAGGPGENGSSTGPGPAGGPGVSLAIQDGKTAKWYAAGGGGGGSNLGNPGGPGGSGIGGSGSGANVAATDGAANTGSGGGAVGEGKVVGAKGGAGIVIIRFVRAEK